MSTNSVQMMQLEIDGLYMRVAEYKQRAEAAEAKLRELIPIARIDALSSTKPNVGLISALNYYSPTIGDLLYAKPFPAPKQEEK